MQQIPTKLSDIKGANFIHIKGARANNLSNIEIGIPKNKLVVFTGVSGSGKSSLTIDTLFAEGQRRYVESLSSYARQFLMRMKKPEVDFIKGICPAIAIEQKVTTRNARSTVGTLTEIYDFLRLLYARIGKTYDQESGEEVRKNEVSDVVDFIKGLKDGTKIQIFSPLSRGDSIGKLLTLALQKGFTRIFSGNKTFDIQSILDKEEVLPNNDHIMLIIDRLVYRNGDEGLVNRIADSILTAFSESNGTCLVWTDSGEIKDFNNRFELNGKTFPEPTPHLFNFNNPYGACPKCEGFSMVMGIDEKKVVPNPSLSVYEEAIVCWKGEKYGQWLNQLIENAHLFDFPIHTPYQELSKSQRKLLWRGNQFFAGIDSFFEELQEKLYKIQNRVMLARYRGRTKCPVCDGSRLREEALFVKIADKSIGDLVELPVDQLYQFFSGLSFNSYDQKIAKRILLEIHTRLDFMLQLGLNYLTLNRLSSTLSGGETQRINLTRMLGSHLTNSMYILDEPSVGLHPKDTSRLVEVLKVLRDKGNTVIVVEHEEDLIRNADYLVDIGPGAGIHGGRVVFAGPFSQISTYTKEDSLTTSYLNGKLKIPLPLSRRTPKRFIKITGARQNNLKNIDVQIPLEVMTVVSGVSGSGKTSLIKDILYPALLSHLDLPTKKSPGSFEQLTGSLSSITGIEMVNQHPIGKSSRSNPVTYVKAYDSIRQLMADRQISHIRGYKPKHFSFNVDGGRCDLCKGEGEQIIEMQFLADIRLQCENCEGKRFKKEVLEVTYKEKNIADILDMSVEEALQFFEDEKEIYYKLLPLEKVGLGYIKLGQSSSTLSGGEAQRVKLASFIGREKQDEHLLFIFDEPTTGLHFHDIKKLLDAFNNLIENGHSVVIVEHNLDIIKCADWVIDLGPDGGINGGYLLFEGPPEELISCSKSYTGAFLKEKITIS
ncbi:MAG: excinuclease ABC subunit UvrA [Saprospiraceae bacterium]|jgi:excinuclease ABC subunit A